MSKKLALTGYKSEQLQHTLTIISLTENVAVVGSAKYLAHKYPGDVDVFEYAVSNSNKENAAEEFAILISNVAKMISIDNTIQMTDFKAGEDLRYKFTEDKDLNEQDNIDKLFDHVDNLVEKKLLSKKEAKDIVDNTYSDAKEAIRKLTTIRWNLPELILGVKKLRNNQIIKLSEAVSMDSMVKMDTVTWFSSRLQSVEIVYILAYTEENGEVVNFYNMGNYMEGILNDINKYKFTNPLKTLKRLWSLSIYLDCDDLIEDLREVFKSDAAALNQILADIETLKHIDKPLDKMMIVVLEFRKRMQNHLDPSEFHSQICKEICDTCDRIYSLWLEFKKTGNFDYGKFYKHLDNLEDHLKPLINEKAQFFYDRIKSDSKYCIDIEKLLLLE